MERLYKISVILIVFILILILTGCELLNNENKGIEDKTTEEISFIENKILTFFSKYVKGEYNQENEELNWNEIENTIIDLNNILDTIILDFSEIEISNDNIIEFRNGINSLSIACTNRDINLVIENFNLLYSLLPKYMEKYSENKNEINILKLKSLVVSSYYYSNLYDWENARSTIEKAEEKYKEMMDDVDYMKEYFHNLNRVYVLIGEIKTAINLEELELTKIKYINFIEKI